jgi:uncharacterized membrane protein YcfT
MTTENRIAWVDTAKGLCILLVVLMHSTLGVEKYSGMESWLHGFIEWARPFRMPDFFLISGLFLARRIDRPWRSYLDSKIVHFAYFYVLWMTLQFVVKGGDIVSTGLEGMAAAYLEGFVNPTSTLWFIYLLAVFFVIAKVSRSVPWPLVLVAAALLEILPIHTGNTVVDEFASRFVYFYAGFVFADRIFALADRLAAVPTVVVGAGLAVWGLANGLAVSSGLAFMPGAGLVFGFAGAAAVVAASVLLGTSPLGIPLRSCGARSIVIYLAFFLFMAGSRTVLMKLGVIGDPGLLSLAVTAAGVAGPLVLFALVRRGPLSFLFHRPAPFRLTERREPDLAAA